MSSIKVAHILHSFLPVTQNWIYNQIKFNLDCEHIAICQFRHNLEQFPLPKVFPVLQNLNSLNRLRLQVLRLWVRKNESFFRKIILQERSDVIHGHFSTESWRVLRIAMQTGIPLATTFYGLDVDKLSRRYTWKKRYAELFEYGKVFIVEGNHMAWRIEALGCPPEKVRVVKLGIDINRIENCALKRSSFPESIKILFVGLEREKKGALDAARAFAQTVEEFPQAELHLVGEGPFKKQVQEILREKGSLEKATFHGFLDVDTYLKLLVCSDIVLVPSCTASDGDTEGGAPVVCIEAQAAAKPVVGTLHCDIPEIVINGISGLLSREHDVAGLALSLRSLIKNKELRIGMGNQGRKNAAENHDIQKQTVLLAEIYHSLKVCREEQ